MNTYIVLLRGVTPNGKNKVPMVRLREVLTGAGFVNVRTYITSGNALVDTGLPAHETGKSVHDLVKKHLGPDLVVVVRTGPSCRGCSTRTHSGRVMISHGSFSSFLHRYRLQRK